LSNGACLPADTWLGWMADIGEGIIASQAVRA